MRRKLQKYNLCTFAVTSKESTLNQHVNPMWSIQIQFEFFDTLYRFTQPDNDNDKGLYSLFATISESLIHESNYLNIFYTDTQQQLRRNVTHTGCVLLDLTLPHYCHVRHNYTNKCLLRMGHHTRGPFLKSPLKFMDPKPYFKI